MVVKFMPAADRGAAEERIRSVMGRLVREVLENIAGEELREAV